MAERNFIIESSSIGVKGHRYKSDNVLIAGKKGAKYLFGKATSVGKISFCIRETTRGSSNKKYHYVATNKKDTITVSSMKKGGTIKRDRDDNPISRSRTFFSNANIIENKLFYLQTYNNNYLCIIDNEVKTHNDKQHAIIWYAIKNIHNNYYTVYVSNGINAHKVLKYSYEYGYNLTNGFYYDFIYDERGILTPYNETINKSVEDEKLRVIFA